MNSLITREIKNFMRIDCVSDYVRNKILLKVSELSRNANLVFVIHNGYGSINNVMNMDLA